MQRNSFQDEYGMMTKDGKYEEKALCSSKLCVDEEGLIEMPSNIVQGLIVKY